MKTELVERHRVCCAVMQASNKQIHANFSALRQTLRCAPPSGLITHANQWLVDFFNDLFLTLFPRKHSARWKQIPHPIVISPMAEYILWALGEIFFRLCLWLVCSVPHCSDHSWCWKMTFVLFYLHWSCFQIFSLHLVEVIVNPSLCFFLIREFIPGA